MPTPMDKANQLIDQAIALETDRLLHSITIENPSVTLFCYAQCESLVCALDDFEVSYVLEFDRITQARKITILWT